MTTYSNMIRTHRWDGSMFRALSDGQVDLFAPSEELGVRYFSDHAGTRYTVEVLADPSPDGEVSFRTTKIVDEGESTT